MTLAQAVLKGDKIDDVIRDAVMMGVAAVQPLLTARTEVPEAAFSRGRRVERWQRIAVASAKQCGRAVVPHIFAPCSLTDMPRRSAARSEAHAGGAGRGDASGASSLAPADASGTAMVLVGPEGGWAEEEVALAIEAGCLTLTLGTPHVTRGRGGDRGVERDAVRVEVIRDSGFGTRDSGAMPGHVATSQ